MSSTFTNYAYLEPNPKSAYKQLFIKGTRIPARTLYGWYMCEDPMSIDEIAANYQLPVAAVREAIAYCQSNPAELREDSAREEAVMAAMGTAGAGYDGKPKLLTAAQRAALRGS
jgi:uncharacterized protein (DUF433 family)